MSDKKILVFGATGAQGGSVVEYLSGHYSLRAVVRNPTAEKAVALAQKGVELVTGDLSTGVPSSAFTGIEAVFLVTVVDHTSFDNEYDQAILVVDAAKKAGVKQFIFSSLPHVAVESNGKLKVGHFDSKARVEEYVRKQGFQYTAFPALAFYYQNFSTFFPPKPDDNGNLVLSIPVTKVLIAVDVSQLGIVVKGIVDNPEKWNGQFIPVAGDNESLQYYADAFSEKEGKKVILNQVPYEVFASFGFPMAAEIAEMFHWFNDYTFFGSRDWQQAKNAFPELRNFKEYLAK